MPTIKERAELAQANHNRLNHELNAELRSVLKKYNPVFGDQRDIDIRKKLRETELKNDIAKTNSLLSQVIFMIKGQIYDGQEKIM